MNVCSTSAFLTGRGLGKGSIPGWTGDARARLDAATAAGGSTVYGSGMNPGFADLLAIVGSHGLRTVDQVRVLESVNTAAYESPEGQWLSGMGRSLDEPDLVGVARRRFGGVRGRDRGDGAHHARRARRHHLRRRLRAHHRGRGLRVHDAAEGDHRRHRRPLARLGRRSRRDRAPRAVGDGQPPRDAGGDPARLPRGDRRRPVVVDAGRACSHRRTSTGSTRTPWRSGCCSPRCRR